MTLTSRMFRKFDRLDQKFATDLEHLTHTLASEDVVDLRALAVNFRQSLVTNEIAAVQLRGSEFHHQGALAFSQILELHPIYTVPSKLSLILPILGRNAKQFAALQFASADLLVDGFLALALADRLTDDHLRALVYLAFSPDTPTRLLRDALRGLRPDPGADPVIPNKLIDLDLLRQSCVYGLMRSMAELGIEASKQKKLNDWLEAHPPKAWADTIQSISPTIGCAGTEVTILAAPGFNFGRTKPKNVEVYFPRRGGGCAPAKEVVKWGQKAIVVKAPSDVGVGCVGFMRIPKPPADLEPGNVAGVASEVAGQMVTCLGPIVAPSANRLEQGASILLGLKMPCPPCLPGDINRFVGGRPIIKKFTVEGERSRVINSGDSVAIKWDIENADKMEIVPVRVRGLRNQLPPIPPQQSLQGTFQTPAILGDWLWEGVYELRAFNGCTDSNSPEKAQVTVAIKSVAKRPGFLWGVATSAYQVEGNINNNDWAFFTGNPAIQSRVNDLTSDPDVELYMNLKPADEALRHGNLDDLRTDLTRARLLGCNAYRFSLEWSRIEPSQDDIYWPVLINYYIPLVRRLVTHGFEPIVTLNHLTLPLWVCKPPIKNKEVLGKKIADDTDAGFQASLRGWENPTVIDEFVEFVTLVVSVLKNEGVRFWITLNEPVGSMIGVGYLGGPWPPGFSLEGQKAKDAYFNLLKAHVRAYDAIKNLDPTAQVSIAHNMFVCTPSTTADDLLGIISHQASSNQLDYFSNQHILDALTSGSVDENIARRSRDRSLKDSQQFFGIPTKDWHPKLDFVGLNYYRRVFAYYHIAIANRAGYLGAAFRENLQGQGENNGLLNDLGWEIFPEGLYRMIMRIHNNYKLPVLVTENGVAEIEDHHRSSFIVSHIEQIQRAQKDGANVLGYVHWSLADNFELAYNYESKGRFGLFRVDRSATDSKGKATLPRKLTEGGLAMRFLGEGGDIKSAHSRFGSIVGAKSAATQPTKSPGVFWRGNANGSELSFYLTRLAAPGQSGDRLLGMIFDGKARSWIHVDELNWDPSSCTLWMFHTFGSGTWEREYSITLDLNTGTFKGSYVESDTVIGNITIPGATVPWTGKRDTFEGMWAFSEPFKMLVSLSNVGRWELPGMHDTWHGRLFSGGRWIKFDSVEVVGNQITLIRTFPIRIFPNLVLRGTISDSIIKGIYPPGSPWTATRLPDDVLP